VFFNYNRVNMALPNELVDQRMNALFGQARADRLRKELEPMKPEERELTIVEAISEALQEAGAKYVLPLRFRSAHGTRTSHHLVFVTKHIRGYEIMKEIMAKESSDRYSGAVSFEYNPATKNQPMLFSLALTQDELPNLLLEQFAGRTMRMIEVYEAHQVGTPYVKANYKHALVELEKRGKISVSPPVTERRKQAGVPTFADNVVVHFPERGTS
jgi:hypothetical protein